MKMLVTKKNYLHVFNETSGKIKESIKVNPGHLSRFYVRIYYKGSYAVFVRTKKIETLPDIIDKTFMLTL